MSARTPFFPTANAAQTTDSQAELSDAMFKPDYASPLHAGSAPGRQVSEGNGNDALTQKPSSGLSSIKHRRGGHSNASAAQKDAISKFRPSMTDSQAIGQGLQRPGTAAPGKTGSAMMRRENSYPSNLRAPTPVKAASQTSLLANGPDNANYDPPFGGNGSFKAPSAPNPLGNRDKPVSVQNDAHISTENTRSGVETRKERSESSFRPPSRQALMTPEHSASSATLLEDDSVDIGDKSMDSSFKLPPPVTAQNGNNNGPRRIVLSGQNGQYFQPQRSPVDFTASGHMVNENGRVVQVTGQKRSRAEMNDDDEDTDQHYGEHTNKRAKLGNAQDERRQFEYAEKHEFYRGHAEQSGHGPLRHESGYANEIRSTPQELSALDELLGLETDGFIRNFLKDYERMVEKWSACTLDEWRAGADKLNAEFTALLEFVKRHITKKLDLYGSLHKKMDDHNEVLAEREKVLEVAKDKLVKDSRNVVSF